MILLNNCYRPFLKKIILILRFFVIGITVFSQKKIDFDSKFLFTTEELGTDIKVLTDSVVFKHENSIMFCDSALFNYGENYFDAYGNIKLVKPTKNKDTVFLYGDTLHYSGKKKYAKVRNRVVLEKDSMVLTTDSLDYDLGKNIGYYFNKGTTKNGKDTIRSVFGYYFADDNEFFFKKDVSLTNPRFKMFSDTLMHNTLTEISYFKGPTEILSDSNYIYCENGWYNHKKNISQFNQNAYLINKEQSLKGDSLYYDRNSGIGKAFKNVIFHDTIQNVLLLGNTGLYNENNSFSLMTDRAVFVQVTDGDSLFLHADTLQTYKDSVIINDKYKTFRIIQAFHHVKGYKSDFQFKCDSMIYNLKDSVIELRINPVMWSDSNQLSAEYIEIQTYRNEVDRIDLSNTAFIISQSDSIRFNQIFGKNMSAYVENKELYLIDVAEEGKTVYFIRDDQNKLIGVNFLNCTDMEIHMKDNKVDMIWFFDKPTGKLYPPLSLGESETKLPNFKWDIEQRPLKKEDIFIRRKEAVETENSETVIENKSDF